MYFILDLCCKVSKADATTGATCTVAPAEPKPAGTARQPSPATPSVLDSVTSFDSSSSSGKAASSGQVSAAAAAAAHATDQAPTSSNQAGPAAAAAAVAAAADAGSTKQQPVSPEAAIMGAVAAAATAAQAAPEPAAATAEHTAATAAHRPPAPAPAVAETAELDKVQAAFSHKPCRACTTAQDMLAAFRSSQFSHSSSSSSSSSSSKLSSSQTSPSSSSSSSSTSSGGGVQAASPPSTSSEADASHHQQQQQQQQPFWFVEDEMPCPPDILELGRATWTLLHSVAAYYPDKPTEQQQQKMRNFVEGLGEFYPCEECRGHLQKELLKHPPEVGSAEDLSRWACRLHNLVNVRLDKPAFDCSKVFERWRDGPAEDPDACGMGH